MVVAESKNRLSKSQDKRTTTPLASLDAWPDKANPKNWNV